MDQNDYIRRFGEVFYEALQRIIERIERTDGKNETGRPSFYRDRMVTAGQAVTKGKQGERG